ncbi:MAG TPA: MFS transporter [Candidatus Saccharimonadales bacterium]|nr:MFS transporter [Candidatus Saccharimonadales bacterium]
MLRHFNYLLHYSRSWKRASFSELSELYTSTTIKTLALSVVNVFVPVYLYKLGFSFSQIALYHLIHYAVRAAEAVVVGKLVGRFGPKHIMVVSYALLMVKMILLVTLPTYGWPLWLIATIDGSSYVMYFIPFHTSFSKLKDPKQEGRQISIVYRWAQIAAAAGPFLGGFVANRYGINYALWLAFVLIVLSVIPLAMSAEPVRKHQKVHFRGMPWRDIKWDMVAAAGWSFDIVTQGVLWPLFIAVFVFQKDVYLSVGLVTSIGLLVSIAVAKAYGQIIDNRKGRKLLRYSTIGEAAMHAMRPLVNAASGAYLFNLAYSPLEVGVSLTFTKGIFDAASSYEGFRIAYLTIMELVSYVQKSLIWLVFYLLTSAGYGKASFQIIFLLAVVGALVVSKERFKALDA